MDKKALTVAIKRCGIGASDEQIEGLLSKIQLLEATGRYKRLLSNLRSANDKNNFLASVLEITIAFQFESASLALEYEIKQNPAHKSSIDFLWKAKTKAIYIETRLLQQDQATSNSIESQLKVSNIYAVTKDGDDEKQDIVRVQQLILEKVQKEDGSPTKFLNLHRNEINIVAVDISQIILGTFDPDDCKLVALGDPSVQAICRRQIFGLFQDTKPDYPEHIQSRARSFSHIRKTLHGVMFLFKRPKTELLNYFLERFIIWNPTLISEDIGQHICDEIELALPIVKKK